MWTKRHRIEWTVYTLYTKETPILNCIHSNIYIPPCTVDHRLVMFLFTFLFNIWKEIHLSEFVITSNGSVQFAKLVVSQNTGSCCYVSGLRLYMQVFYQLNWREINFWRSLVATTTQSPKSNLARCMLSKHQQLIQFMRTSEFRYLLWCWYLDWCLIFGHLLMMGV